MHELMDTRNHSRRAALIAAHVGLGVVFLGALALLFGYVVMALWNSVVAGHSYVLPAILGDVSRPGVRRPARRGRGSAARPCVRIRRSSGPRNR